MMIILSEKIMMIIWSTNITFRKNIVSTLIDEPLKGVAEEITVWQVHKSAEKENVGHSERPGGNQHAGQSY